MAIRNGEIVYAGGDAGAEAFRGPGTRVVELRGATVLPGLVDSHTHVDNLGTTLAQVDLRGVETEAAAVERVAARAEEAPAGERIVGWGWDEGAWAGRYPDVEDKAWAEERLGPERIRWAYAWRTLREAGADLTLNSDLPGSDWDPFYGLHAAITRRSPDLEPRGGWYPDEALTPEEAIRGYSSWSAYAAFLEGETGVIAPGRWADLTVVDLDPFRVGASDVPGRLLEGQALLTVVGGRVVHDAR